MADLTHSTHENQFTGSHRAALASLKAAPALTILTEDDPLPASKRLVVILPDADFDIASLPKRIWDLTAAGSRSVLLMIKPNNEEDQFYAQMNLTTLAAIIRDTHFEVQTQLVVGQSLEQAACQLAQAGDVFVCFAEQQVGGRAIWGMQKRPLAESLAQATQQPVYTLEGAVREHASRLPAKLLNLLFMLVCLLILAAFFALEVWIDQNSSGTMNTVLMLLAVFVEVCIIGAFAKRV